MSCVLTARRFRKGMACFSGPLRGASKAALTTANGPFDNGRILLGDNNAVGAPGPTSPHTLTGTAGNDQIIAGSDGYNLFGGNRNDALVGGAGNNNLNGENGNDLMWGGAGADRFDGGTGIDTVHYN